MSDIRVGSVSNLTAHSGCSIKAISRTVISRCVPNESRTM